MTITPFVSANWKNIVKVVVIVIVLTVFDLRGAKLFVKPETVTIVKTVVDTTQVEFLKQQLVLKEAEIEADTLALDQFASQVDDMQASKDSAIAFYQRTLYGLQHPSDGTIVIPKATASKVFQSTDKNGFTYQDTVSVTYSFPPLDRFELSLILAPRSVITTHEDTTTVTTLTSRFPKLYVGPALTTHSLFGGVGVGWGNYLLTVDYRLASFGWTPGTLPLDNFMVGLRYKLF